MVKSARLWRITSYKPDQIGVIYSEKFISSSSVDFSKLTPACLISCLHFILDFYGKRPLSDLPSMPVADNIDPNKQNKQVHFTKCLTFH